ncbi:LysR family transcriptional regulator [Vibrio sp. 404]|uniref:LysR family transcriptional regulator n=1 Tax=Vibrio marinisediminis TaxID=2758441 RepID=A0A7W2IUD8_9VIBR|nr:LysR family transcriptional regulator [Vibrio marinisediminis]MBA5763521.1 LysR family transcriptional regulator [Vibrio marinisediminis]
MSYSLLSSRQPILDKMVFFCAVIQTGSFREAAIQQGISPAAGSRWVKELEDVLSVELVKRSTRQLVATQAGQLLYDQFSPLLPDINNLCEEVQNLAEKQQGEIRLSSTPLFARQYLTKIVAEYMEMYPKVNFRIFIEAGEFDPLLIDFAFRASGSFEDQPKPDSLLVRRRLLQEPLYLCASPNYLAEHGMPENPNQLSEHRCLYAQTLLGGNRWSFEINGKQEIVIIRDTLECDNSEMLLDLALGHAGIAYLPHSLVNQKLKSGELLHILPTYQCATFDIDLYYRPRAPMPERCNSFKQYLFERVNSLSA